MLHARLAGARADPARLRGRAERRHRDGGVAGGKAILAIQAHHPGDARAIRRDGRLFEIANGRQFGKHVIERGLGEGRERDE